MTKLRDILGLSSNDHERDYVEEPLLPDQHMDTMERDIELLDDDYSTKERRVQKEAEKQIQDAAEDSLRKIHVIKSGLCPHCGEHLKDHLFASVCEACGWHSYEKPQKGVRVHIIDGTQIEGDSCYVVKSGEILVVSDDVVVARLFRPSVRWIEYMWQKDEVITRYRQIVGRMKILCGWCNEEADPGKKGFTLIHVAFGAVQERYVFCSEQCYEAFRKMYPSRVHRNCYERNCRECDLCIKRYDDETDDIRLLAKDMLKLKSAKK